MYTDEIIKIVQSEMKPSMGCTEPVAIGLAVSNTCAYLDKKATKIQLKISSNIFKNAFCVKIPNTTEAGIPLAAALGYLLCKKDNNMEIFSKVTQQLVDQAYILLEEDFIKIDTVSDNRFYIEITAKNEEESVHTLTLDRHDNLVLVEKNETLLLDKRKDTQNSEDGSLVITQHSIKELVDLAENIQINKLYFLRDAVQMNLAAAKEGLIGNYGMQVGKNIKKMLDNGIIPNDLFYYVKMMVSAASDCRMGGGTLSAMTVLGSGNQGFEATLPVIATCEYQNVCEEKMLRALFISILLTIRQKFVVGRLSPICGATLAAAASSAAITWILGGTVAQMEGAMQTMYANITGMMCDGAKDGCAIKLATCSGEAVMAARLALMGSIACKTDGIVSEKVEDSIQNVARLSKEGMKAVDLNVIDILVQKSKK